MANNERIYYSLLYVLNSYVSKVLQYLIEERITEKYYTDQALFDISFFKLFSDVFNCFLI